MESTTLIGLVAGILTSASLLPQFIKTFREKKAGDISLFMLLMLLAGLGTWIVYGIIKNDWPIIITNSFSFLINCCIVVLRIKYN